MKEEKHTRTFFLQQQKHVFLLGSVLRLLNGSLAFKSQEHKLSQQ